MPKRCATLEDFLSLTGAVFNTVGPASTGSFTVLILPLPGDTISISSPLTFPPTVESLEAGVDFPIGIDPETTAANIAAALGASTLVDAYNIPGTPIVELQSKATGPVSILGLTSSDPLTIEPSGPTLVGGDELVNFALGCTCQMINLECWGVKATCGHVYLAAHFLAVQTGEGGGESGPVNRKKVDKIEISLAATGLATGIDANFGSTKWGRLYLALKKTLFIPPLPGRGPFSFCVGRW